MSRDHGPWRKDSGPDPGRPNLRIVLWLALVAAIVLGLGRLSSLFPGQISSDWQTANLVRWIALLVLLSAGLAFAPRLGAKEVLRNIALWSGVVALLVLAYTYQDELNEFGLRLRSELVPGEPISRDDGVLVLSQSADGHFYAVGEANGARVRFLIDTGASDTVLSPSDAARIGIDVNALDYSRIYGTANGLGQGAPYRLESLSIGPIAFQDVPVSINQAEMGSSLLGMSFLRRLKSFEVEGRQLYLRWR